MEYTNIGFSRKAEELKLAKSECEGLEDQRYAC